MRLLLITLLGLYCSLAVAQRPYDFEIQINELTYQKTVHFSKDNNFEVFLPIKPATPLWRLQAHSPQLPQKLITLTLHNEGIKLRLLYRDPRFEQISFDQLSIQELILYIENEPSTLIANLFIEIARHGRADLFELIPFHFQSLQSFETSYLSGLQVLIDQNGRAVAEPILVLLNKTDSINPLLTRVLLQGIGIGGVSELEGLRIKIKEDQILRQFVSHLAQLSPGNTIFNYLLDLH
ncbi:MAG: hypothetical protein ACLGG0_08645 [Bacteriovoracia bacterium]